jgi:hypothetical protein
MCLLEAFTVQKLLFILVLVCFHLCSSHSFPSVRRHLFQSEISFDHATSSLHLPASSTRLDANNALVDKSDTDSKPRSTNLHRWDVSIHKTLQSALVSGLMILAGCASNSHADTAMLPYTADDKSYSFRYPSDFELSPKLVKTHKDEVFFRSKDVKGYSMGVAVSSQ